MKHSLFISLIVILSSSITYSQDEAGESFRKLFTEAGYHMEFKNYRLALPVYLQLDSMDRDNANIQYRIGVCYLNSSTEKTKAIPYLEKAVLKTSGNYDDLAYTERKAPEISYYELARAYHLDYQLDTAIAIFEKYKSLLHKKHWRVDDINRQIEMCNFAKSQISSPIDVEIVNLGETINTESSDFCPVISADESMLIFTSRREGSTGGMREEDGRYYEDIYISYRDKGEWLPPEKIGQEINTDDHEAAIGLSADGQQLLIFKSDNGGDIYQSYLMGNAWTVPEKMGSNINTPAWEPHSTINSDGSVLYFVSDRKRGFGGRDIYRCKKLPNGDWAKAENLGPAINTKYDEDAPFIHPDGVNLFFSSKGHNSMGGFDIFFSELSEEGAWGEPKNIGYPINTTDDDVFYVPTSDGKRAYFSSVRAEGLGEKDIYVVNNIAQKVTALTIFKGTMPVTDIEGNPIASKIIIIDNATGDEFVHTPNAKTGKYVLILKPGKDYKIVYEADGYVIHHENVFIPEESAYQVMEKAVELKPISFEEALTEPYQPPEETIAADTAGEKVINIIPYQEFFSFNVRNINTESEKFKTFINSFLEAAKARNTIDLHIEASASKVSTRTFESNEFLAQMRGEDAKKLLIEALRKTGIDVSKVTYETTFLVQGPDYKYAHLLDPSIYSRYQYVKIWAEETGQSGKTPLVKPKETPTEKEEKIVPEETPTMHPPESKKDSLTQLMNRAPASIKKQVTIPEYVAWSKTAGNTKNIYAVQVGAFIKPVPLVYFENIKNPKSFLGKDNITRYVVGQMFNDRTLAEFLKDEIKENTAYKDAFIVELDQILLFTKPDEIHKPEPVPAKNEVIYSVQIGAYKDKIPLNLSLLYMKIEGVKAETTPDGTLVLTAGSFKSYDDAEKKKNLLTGDGIKDAYIVAYLNGQKISIEEAKEFLKEK